MLTVLKHSQSLTSEGCLPAVQGKRLRGKRQHSLPQTRSLACGCEVLPAGRADPPARWRLRA